MKYFYANVPFPKNDPLVRRIHAAAESLHDKLRELDLKSTGISEYNQRYLGDKMKFLTGVLQLNTWLIYQALKNCPVPAEECVLLDHGGRSGLISLLAGEVGLKQVLYNDIYDVSCDDVRNLADRLGIRIDHFICGDVEPLVAYLNEQRIVINSMVSYDVIEHVYDIEGFLKTLRRFSTGEFNFTFGSGANTLNPMVARKLGARHHAFEYEDRKKEWGHKERDTLKSYVKIREEIIVRHEPTLSGETVHDLARKTRGLIEPDIVEAVEEFKRAGKISYVPDHPTNTCDPLTGNWAEHLMDTRRLVKILQKEGAEAHISPGYCELTATSWKNLILKTMNIAISALGRRGGVLSPYFILEGRFP